MLYRLEILWSRSALRTSPTSCGQAMISKTPLGHRSRSRDAAPDAVRVPAIRQSGNQRRRRPATYDQRRDDRDSDLLVRRVTRLSWTTRCARSIASSSPSPAFALMRSMIPIPSRRAASNTTESRLPVRAARTRTWRMSPSSIESVVFTFAIFPYCHSSQWVSCGTGVDRPTGHEWRNPRTRKRP